MIIELYTKHTDAPWWPKFIEVDSNGSFWYWDSGVDSNGYNIVDPIGHNIAVLALRGALVEWLIRKGLSAVPGYAANTWNWCIGTHRMTIGGTGFETIDAALIAAYEAVKETK